MRAFWTGTANASQQDTLRRWLMYVTGADPEFADLPFRPEEHGGERATNFALGKYFVGIELRKLLRPEFNHREPPPDPRDQTVYDRLKRHRHRD